MAILESSVASSITVYLTLGCFIGVEPLTRKNAAAKSLSRGEFDRGSTVVIGSAFGLSISMLLLTLALNALHIGLLPLPLGAGLGCQPNCRQSTQGHCSRSGTQWLRAYAAVISR